MSATRNTWEYRAIIECTEDPCTYCRNPAARIKTLPVFGTAREARAHGQDMARNVYGASVHRVVVERRSVSEWAVAPEPVV